MIELSKEWKQRFRRRLRAWYRRHRRDLPWRQSRDAYRVWISEVMLQQTQVATVRDYYARFVARYPTVEALAEASERDVLRLWEGLGYYRRARQLHAAAKIVRQEYEGEFPSDLKQLQKLPGIGRYTAGAIASIAFDVPAAILEANTERLYARLVAYEGSPTSSAGKRALWSVAEGLVPRRNAGEFNQALMELGSLVCKPREPDCAICPVADLCAARVRDIVGRIPPPKERKTYQELHEAAVVIRRNGRVLVRQCGPQERWAGLWDFPRVSVPQDRGASGDEALIRSVAERFGASIELERHLATIRHGVTRFRITLDCYTARLANGGIPRREKSGLKWVATRSLQDYPLSTTGRQIAKMIGAA